MAKQVKPISDTRIEVIETIEQRQEYEKITLEAQKADYVAKIAEIDDLLTYFTETPK